jgi:tRNA dimethylallyltransferase
MMNDIPLIVIMGATGSGKSSLAMKIAEKLSAEIISMDSMQIYREMDIGTAKPTLDEQKMISHHMIDILDIHDRIDIYYYVEKTKEAIKNILSRNKVPILAGGSGLYIKSLLYGLDPLPSDPELRMELLKKYESKEDELRAYMQENDKEAFLKFNEHPRKLLRALEVLTITGKSITVQQSEWEKKELKYRVNAYNVKLDRPILFDRIGLRTQKMLNDGWVEETKKLVKKGLLDTPTAWQAIGYPIIANYLENTISYEEMKMRIISSTKKYARRQETWFKHQHPEVETINIDTNTVRQILRNYT